MPGRMPLPQLMGGVNTGPNSMPQTGGGFMMPPPMAPTEPMNLPMNPPVSPQMGGGFMDRMMGQNTGITGGMGGLFNRYNMMRG
jgi:hypothetical protein